MLFGTRNRPFRRRRPTRRCAASSVTGNEKAFAAGADVTEMADRSFADMFGGDYLAEDAERIARCRKPVIAAVQGYALGGGWAKLAMMCDFHHRGGTTPSSASPR